MRQGVWRQDYEQETSTVGANSPITRPPQIDCTASGPGDASDARYHAKPTIEEVRAARDRLAAEVLALIRAFEDQTDAHVERVGTETAEYVRSERSQRETAGVTVFVSL